MNAVVGKTFEKMKGAEREQRRMRMRYCAALALLALALSLPDRADAAMITIENVIDGPRSKVATKCQSSTRADDWGAREIQYNETFAFFFTPSPVLFNTEVWCDALREADGASAHFRVYWQLIDWPFESSIKWELRTDELRRLPIDGLGALYLRGGRYAARTLGLWSLLNSG